MEHLINPNTPSTAALDIIKLFLGLAILASLICMLKKFSTVTWQLMHQSRQAYNRHDALEVVFWLLFGVYLMTKCVR